MDRLLEEIPAPLFDEWLAFYSLDPWGENRADFRIAMLTSFVHNYAGVNPKTKPRDFMPYLEKEEPTPEELQTRLMEKFGLNPDGSPMERVTQWKERE